MTNPQAPQPAQGNEDDVRKAFESEMRFEDVWGHKNLRRDKRGDYLNSWTGSMWEVWKACAATYAEQVARAERNRDMWREQCRGQAAQLEAMRVTPAPESAQLRQRFTAWMAKEMCFSPDEMAFDDARRCFTDLRIHVAWCAYREAALAAIDKATGAQA